MKTPRLSAAALVLCAMPLAGPLAEPAEDAPHPHVVVILAHPDDELAFAPALHRMAREGHEVSLVFATTGDQGPGVTEMERGAELGRVRMGEAACSKAALGAARVVSLDLGDGTLGFEARREGSAANRLLAALPALIAGADTVITFGPEGGYGHSDHRITGAVVTQYVQSLGAAERPRLLYPALVHAPLPEPLARQGWSLTAPDLASARAPYDAVDLAAVIQAAQCYKTQFDDATRAMIAPGFDQLVWKGEVRFRPAFP